MFPYACIFSDSSLVIDRYFRHSKITSLQRQLNLYGFTHVTKGSLTGTYYHPMFQRGHPEALDSIKRVSKKLPPHPSSFAYHPLGNLPYGFMPGPIGVAPPMPPQIMTAPPPGFTGFSGPPPGFPDHSWQQYQLWSSSLESEDRPLKRSNRRLSPATVERVRVGVCIKYLESLRRYPPISCQMVESAATGYQQSEFDALAEKLAGSHGPTRALAIALSVISESSRDESASNSAQSASGQGP